jgi:hypothetical protein
MSGSRRAELHRRRLRRKKLGKLRDRYARAETDADRTAVLQKIAEVAPGVASELSAGERAVERGPTMATPPDAVVKKRASPARRGAPPSAAAAESKGAHRPEGRD